MTIFNYSFKAFLSIKDNFLTPFASNKLFTNPFIEPSNLISGETPAGNCTPSGTLIENSVDLLFMSFCIFLYIIASTG